MSDTVTIVLIIAVAVIVVLLIFRKQVSRFFIKASKDGLEADLTTREPSSEPSPTTTSETRPGVTISRNKQIGKGNKITVGQSDALVEDNLQLGQDQEITAKPDSPSETVKQ